MGKIIAIAGKGGVGKSTISSLLVRYLANTKCSVLAVDADPNSNLGDYLGFNAEQDIGKIVDEIGKKIDQIPLSMSKDEYIAYQVETTLGEAEGYDLITMGRPEGSGCYCYVNNVLRNVLSKLMSSYDYVVIDNEAGLEHLSRKTVKRIDTLLLVSDDTPQGLKAAKRIYNLVNELKIEYRKICLVINKARAKRQIDFPTEVTGFIFDDAEIIDYTQGKIAKLTEDNKLIKETNELFSMITERSEPCLKN